VTGRRNSHTDEPGYVAARVNSLTNMHVVLYDAKRALLASEGGRWALFCEGHGAVFSVSTRERGRIFLASPSAWCASCRAITETRHEPSLLLPQRPEPEKRRYWAQLAKGNQRKCALFEQMYGEKPDHYWTENEDA